MQRMLCLSKVTRPNRLDFLHFLEFQKQSVLYGLSLIEQQKPAGNLPQCVPGGFHCSIIDGSCSMSSWNFIGQTRSNAVSFLQGTYQGHIRWYFFWGGFPLFEVTAANGVQSASRRNWRSNIWARYLMYKSENILVTLYSESMYVTCFEFPWERTQSLVGTFMLIQV